MALEPYNTRHTPPKADTARLYRPRVFNRVSKARFTRNRLGELARHVGRQMTFAERIVVNRIVSLEWWLYRLDARIDAGEDLSAHAVRARLAAENRLRLDLAALDHKPLNSRAAILIRAIAEKPPDALDYGKAVASTRRK